MSFSGELYSYQQEAFDKIVKRRAVLVAYEMGLGKTPITIAALERLMDDGIIREPGLIIALSSLKYQWAEQIKLFTNNESVPLVVDGTPKQRSKQYARIRNWISEGIDYAILNYEQVVNDWDQVKKLPRGFVVIDEATAIKSFRARRSKAVKKLSSPVRIALTGTPIENGKPEEVFSIMQFVDPTVLGSFTSFDAKYIVRTPWGQVERYKNLPDLHARLEEASVRKRQLDADVAPYLPDVIHNTPLRITLDAATRDVYQQISNDLLADLSSATELYGESFSLEEHYGIINPRQSPADKLRGMIMSKIQVINMLLAHPSLVVDAATKYNSDQEIGGSAYANYLVSSGLLDDITRTPKLDALVDYVRDFLNEDPSYKVVIFTRYVTMTDYIAASLAKYGVRTFTGRHNAKQKEANKRDFQVDPHIRILVSSDAGGYGVDLPQANMLINYGLPDKAGAALQRNSRIVRVSSSWSNVVIQDLIAKDTLEERQWALLRDKNAVQSAIVDGEGINPEGGVTLTAGSLSSFLLAV